MRLPPRPLLALLALLALPIPAPAQEAGPADKVLLCLGDSLTAGYGLDEAQAWPALLQLRLDRELPGWRVSNAGVSGDTTEDALGRLDWLLRSPPTAVFICLGGNDGLRGLPVEGIGRRLRSILSRFRAAGAAVFMSGMDLPSNLGPEYRGAFKALFPRVAREAQAAFMPFLLVGVAGVPDLNQADGIHPTAQGEILVAAHAGDFLLPRLRRLNAGAAAAAKHRVLRRRRDLEAEP